MLSRPIQRTDGTNPLFSGVPLEDIPFVPGIVERLETATGGEPGALCNLFRGILVRNSGYEPGLVRSLVASLEQGGWAKDSGLIGKLVQGVPSLSGSQLGGAVLARLFDLQGHPEEAIQRLLQVQRLLATPDAGVSLELARLYTKQNRFQEACFHLRRVVEISAELQLLTMAARLLDRLGVHPAEYCSRSLQVAVLCPHTTDLWTPILKLYLYGQGIWCQKIYVPAYGTYRQEILNPDSSFYAQEPDLVILAPTWRELSLPAFTKDPDSLVESHVAATLEQWALIRERVPTRVIQHNFEVPTLDPAGHLSSALPGGRATVIRRINLEIASKGSELGVVVLDLDQVAGSFGKRAWGAPEFWHRMKQYPAPDAIPSLVCQEVALIRASMGLTKKVLVLDLDNTLWGGVIGEDGLRGIKIGPPSAVGEAHTAIQVFAQQLKERGVLLAVCSKNNEEDAQSPFLQHESMVLNLSDFAAFSANWSDKPSNIKGLAKMLNLGTDSIVFLDDNPTERALVREVMPEIAVPELPKDPSGYLDALDTWRYFDAVSLSEEDLNRSSQYRSNQEREKLLTSAGSLNDFLAGLEMECTHGSIGEDALPRVVQLLGKTNQFNLTTQRHSEEVVRQMLRTPGACSEFFRLRDKFDDNGIVGVILAIPSQKDPHELIVDTWLMSCRVIGRSLEQFMFNVLLHNGIRFGYERIRARYKPTPKNGMVLDLLDRLGFQRVATSFSCDQEYELVLASAVTHRVDFIKDCPYVV